MVRPEAVLQNRHPAAVVLAVWAATLATAAAFSADPSRSTQAASRESRVSWAAPAAGARQLRLEVDADGDGVIDFLEAERGVGSGFSRTKAGLVPGGHGIRLKRKRVSP